MCQGCSVRMVVEEAKMALPAVFCPACSKGQTPVPPPKSSIPAPARPPTVDLREKIRQKVQEEKLRATTPQPGPSPAAAQVPKPAAPILPKTGPKIVIRKPPPKV